MGQRRNQKGKFNFEMNENKTQYAKIYVIQLKQWLEEDLKLLMPVFFFKI